MNNIRLILPVFGAHPHNYFGLFLNSIFQNNNIVDMLIVTDASNAQLLSFFPKYSNISLLVISHEELAQKVKDAAKKILNVSIETPFVETANNRNGYYKLTDYKFFLGEMFKEQLIGYTYWGFLDWDTIFGDLRGIIPNFEEYDVVGTRGHFCCVKNTSKILEIIQNEDNWRFFNGDMQKDKQLVKQKICVPSKGCAADEHFIQPTLMHYAKENPDTFKVLDTIYSDIICDVSLHNRDGSMPGVGFNLWRGHNYKNQYFLFDKNKVFKISDEDNIKTEHAYIHLMGRLMCNSIKEEEISDSLRFTIHPNFFTKL